MAQNNEILELFLAEALEFYEKLNLHMVELEKNHHDQNAIDALFRVIHTLKGNAASMGFSDLAELSHSVEDIFGLIRAKQLEIHPELFQELFRAIDLVGDLIEQLRDPEKKVAYKGLKRKLEVRYRDAKNALQPNPPASTNGPEKATETVTEKGSENSVNDNNPSNQTETSLEPTAEAKKDSEKTKHLDLLEKEFLVEVENEDLSSDSLENQGLNQTAISLSDRVSIPIYKLDKLLNLVGELLIEKDRINNQYKNLGLGRATELARLNRLTGDLQYSIMDVRLIQVNVLFQKFNRIVRDLAVLENKEVQLELEGTEIEIDRNVLQAISDSLIHLVRNAIGHGIETPEERVQLGKPRKGTVKLKAFNDRDHVVIQVQDDGKGIDANKIKEKVLQKKWMSADIASKLSDSEIIRFIFEPGFSSVDKVTEVSGRGVGMDVVKRSVEGIGGGVEILTEPGSGTIFHLTLPSTMAVKPVMLFLVEGLTYSVSLSYLESVTSYQPAAFSKVGKGWVVTYQNSIVPVLMLSSFFGLRKKIESQEDFSEKKQYHALIINYLDKKYALIVDVVTQQRDIVEKPLSPPLDSLKFFSGSTILGNGEVSLVIDIPSILSTAFRQNQSQFVFQLSNG